MGQHYLLSASVRDFTMRDINQLTEEGAMLFIAKLRWGSSEKQICPDCGEMAKHYYRRSRLQWRCRSCEHCFSVSSRTIFASRKLPYKLILQAVTLFASAAKGLSALQLSQQLGVQHKTASCLVGKLRELLLICADRSPLKGIVQVDGMYICGKPRRPNKRKKISTEEAQNRLSGKKPSKPKRGQADYANMQKRLNRRVVLSLRQLGDIGQGGMRTIVCVAKAENEDNALAFIRRYVQQGSIVMTDENPAYSKLSIDYTHKTVLHSVEYVAGDGTNDNQCESYNSRLRRMEKGISHRMTPKYLKDKANEMAWREDFRRKSVLTKITYISHNLTKCGHSRWWRGYWQGHYRDKELLLKDWIHFEDQLNAS